MAGLRLGGVPLHPLLVHFPVVAWCLLPALDAALLLGAPPGLAEVACWTASLGLIGALAAMTAGIFDLKALVGERVNAAALTHMMWMSGTFAVAVAALLLRLRPEASVTAVLVADLVVLVGLAVGGHLGAELVYRHGAGVAPLPERANR